MATMERATTIGAAQREARAKLGNSFSASLDARLLLQEATGFTHAELIANAENALSSEALVTFERYISRRLAHEPVSRILGRREFYGRRFSISPAVLDPRPDTEVVVELAFEHVKTGRFLDLGTGSGAIAVTLCAENENLRGVASDVSQSALDVAQRNAASLGVAERLGFTCASWFEGVEGPFDLVVSNPPYIAEGEILPPEVRGFDPPLALFAGPSGLEAYGVIARQAKALLAPTGVVVLEHGYTQADEIKQIFLSQGYALLAAAKDLQDHDRALAFTLI